jgi:hypothetical protein
MTTARRGEFVPALGAFATVVIAGPLALFLALTNYGHGMLLPMYLGFLVQCVAAVCLLIRTRKV